MKQKVEIERPIEELHDVDGYVFNTLEDCYFPKILDNDPEKAALGLTRKDLKEALNNIREAFVGIQNEEPKYKLLTEAIMYSNENFMWFSIFVDKAEKLLQRVKTVYIPYDKIPKNREKIVRMFPPFYVLPVKEKYKAFNDDVGKNLADKISFEVPKISSSLVDLYRMTYIREEFEVSEFGGHYPRWYTLPVVVYQKYNPYLNSRVKICYQNNEFRYYIAGASDNWEEIFDVPLEIDAIISTLLFY